MGLKLGPNSHWPYHQVQILGKPELLKIFNWDTHRCLKLQLWCRLRLGWGLGCCGYWTQCRVLRFASSSGVWVSLVWVKWSGKAMVSDGVSVEKRRIRLELKGVPIMVGDIRRRLILVSHVDYICLLGCDWKEGTSTRWVMNQRKTMEAMAFRERLFFFFLDRSKNVLTPCDELTD